LLGIFSSVEGQNNKVFYRQDPYKHDNYGCKQKYLLFYKTCVSVMKFGVFGREDGFLIIIDEKGGIYTKIL
jgi:hypothetical protein